MPRGQPQIEVVFDIDANGILNVSASEKSTGKAEKITITNDKGRLSKEDIERMVEEAEKYKQQDEELRECIEAKGAMENYMYMVKGSMKDLKEKIDEDTTEKLNACIRDIEAACEGFAGDRKKEEYEVLKKTLEDEWAKVMGKIQAESGPPPTVNGEGPGPVPPGAFNPDDIKKAAEAATATGEAAAAGEPQIDEVD